MHDRFTCSRPGSSLRGVSRFPVLTMSRLCITIRTSSFHTFTVYSASRVGKGDVASAASASPHLPFGLSPKKGPAGTCRVWIGSEPGPARWQMSVAVHRCYQFPSFRVGRQGHSSYTQARRRRHGPSRPCAAERTPPTNTTNGHYFLVCSRRVWGTMCAGQAEMHTENVPDFSEKSGNVPVGRAVCTHAGVVLGAKPLTQSPTSPHRDGARSWRDSAWRFATA